MALALALPALAIGAHAAAFARESRDAHDVAPEHGRFVPAGSLELFVMERGPPSGRPVLMIPGTMAWSETYAPLAERLGAAGYRAIAVDLPPFGYSDRPDTGDYGRAAQAERLGALLDALDLRDAIVLGHSFGAGATVETAMARPDRVSGCVLLAGALGLSELRAGHPIEVPALLAAPLVRTTLIAGVVTNPLTTGGVLRSMMANDDPVTERRIAVYQAPFVVRGLTPAVSEWVASGLFADERSARSGRDDAYRAYGNPVLLVWGAADTVTPVAQGRELAALLPHAELVELAAVGHLPHVEDLEGVAAALLPWLARSPG